MPGITSLHIPDYYEPTTKKPETQNPALPVVSPRILNLEHGARKHFDRISEIQSPLFQGGVPLRRVEGNFH
jgi:hypothetical protein